MAPLPPHSALEAGIELHLLTVKGLSHLTQSTKFTEVSNTSYKPQGKQRTMVIAFLPAWAGDNEPPLLPFHMHNAH